MKKLFLLAVILLAFQSPVSLAGGGGGSIVYDPWNWSENSLNTIKTVRQLSEDFKRTQNELNQIQQLYHLMSNSDLNLQPLNRLYNTSINRLDTNLQTAEAVSYDAESLHHGFHSVYPEWEDEEGVTAQGYTDQIAKWRTYTRNAVIESFEGHAISPEIKESRLRLNNLLVDNTKVEGELQGIQLANQISGIVAEQLILLNEITAKQFRAQSAVMMDDLARRREDGLYREKVIEKTRIEMQQIKGNVQ